MSAKIYGSNETTIVTQPRADNEKQKTTQKQVENLLKSYNLLIIECINECNANNSDDRKPKKYFRICDENDKQILSATTENVFCTRIGFGQIPYPLLDFKLLYPTDSKYDAFHLFRSLRCDAFCCPCSQQMVDIYNSSKRHIVGSVRQQCNLINAIFHLCDSSNCEVAIVKGQNLKLDVFKVYTLNEAEIGSICYKSAMKIDDNAGLHRMQTWVVFFTEGMNVELKVLVIGAAFLISCIYNESPSLFRHHE